MQNPAMVDGQLSHLRVAIIHYWFVGRAGGERVVEAIAEVFPQADLFSLGRSDDSCSCPAKPETRDIVSAADTWRKEVS